MKNSDIAFLMPAYNTEPALLHAAVESALAQGRTADLVIVDDGSKVPVSTLLEPDPRINIIRLEQNGGVTAARNVGLHHIVEAGYDFIACIDSDDVVRPDRLEIQMKRFDADPSLALLGAMAPAYDPDGNFLFMLGTRSGPDAVARRVRYRQPFVHSTFLFRTDVVRKLGYYSTDFPAAEDYEFIFRVMADGNKIDCVPEALATYLINPKGISLNNWRLQKLMRLKVQMRYFAPLEPASYLGFATSVISYILPFRVSTWIKKLIKPRLAT